MTHTVCPVEGKTISEVLRAAARQVADQDALVFAQLDWRMSYAQLDAEVDRVAKGLLAMGIGKGHHVAVWATNVPQWPLLQLATARIGAVLVTVNPAYRAKELAYVLTQGDIHALFLIHHFKSSNYFAAVHDICPELSDSIPGKLSAADCPQLRWVVDMQGEGTEGMYSWQKMVGAGASVSDAALHKAEQACSADEPINIQYTSGTTGFPKAAMLTHRNILMNGYYVTGCQNITHEDRMCIPVPYYHCFGLVMGTLGAVTRGAAMIIPAEYFDPGATLSAIAQERATTVYGVPTMFIAMLEHPDFSSYDFPSLRSGIMAGSPCPIEVMRQVMERMGAKEITIAYGLTESSPVITQTRVDDPVEVRVQTVGAPLPGVEVRIVDPATGSEVKEGEQGELCARGHGTMLGYYNDAAATRATIDAEGWLHTGDLARRHANNCYSITGRLKDVVIRGGENIYPREIEEHLFTHPAIEQVAAFGIPNDKYGEELCVWVQTKPDTTLTEQEVRAYCKQHLAHYKTPRYVRFVEEFPQTVTGKIQKFKMRQAMMDTLGLHEPSTA